MLKTPLFIEKRNLTETSDYYSLATSCIGHIDRMDYTGFPMPDEFNQLLSLDIYIGRGSNAGHRAFFHSNYALKEFVATCRDAAQLIGFHELDGLLQDFGKWSSRLMPWTRRTASSSRSIRNTKLEKQLEEFDSRLLWEAQPLRLSEITQNARAEAAGWVNERAPSDALPIYEQYYFYCSAWFLGNVPLEVFDDYESRIAALEEFSQPPPNQ